MASSSSVLVSRTVPLLRLIALGPVATALAAPGDEVRELTAAPDLATVPSSQPAAEAAASAAEVAVAPRWQQGLGLDLGLRLDAFVTQGRTYDVDVAAGQNSGLHGVNGAVDLELAYAPPLPAPWRIVAVAIGVGYTPYFGTGQASWIAYAPTPSGVGQVTSLYRYDWSVHLVPMNLGLRVQPPLEQWFGALPVGLDLEGGFAGGLAFASSSLTMEGADDPFARDVGSSDFGLGYYLGAGLRVPIAAALGSVVAGYRYSAVRLDFHRPDFNATWGDLGGHHLLVGYRLEL
jgi:hypothetical protein